MFMLEDFGITQSAVLSATVCCAVTFCLVCAAGILLWCLFSIGLADIAKARGEEKEWYAYLPLLRFYTLGKMIKGSEKVKKVFACLLPSLAVVRFVLKVASVSALVRAAFGLIFAAEKVTGGTVDLSAFVNFPIAYCATILVITLIVSAAYKIISAICLYGAFETLGTGKAVVFTVLSFICAPLGAILVFVASRIKAEDKTAA